MKQSLKRWTALLLALVMTVSLLPVVSLPTSAQQDTVGTLDHTDIISLPITIRNHSADGMLFEWDGLGNNEYEEKPFRNPYNTSDITEPIPFVGVNLAVGQLFCNDWDVSLENLNRNRTGFEEGLSYHYGETCDSRYAHIQPNNKSWREYPVWDSTVEHGDDTSYMIIRFRTNGTVFEDTLFVKRYKNNNDYWQSGVNLTATNAYGPYKLVGIEDGWTTIAVDLNDEDVNPIFHNSSNNTNSEGYPGRNDKISKISIGFNNNSDHDYQLDISFIAFFIRLLDNSGGGSLYHNPFRYCGYDFINQDYCFRMNDPTITVVEPRPAIGINLLLDWTTGNLSISGTGAHLDNHASADTEPGSDWDKYITISAGSEPATATLWASSSSEDYYPAGMARYAALRCKADFNAELTILANGSEVVTSFNPATVTEGGDVLDIQTDTTTENGATVSWKTVIIDTHYDGSVVSMELQVPAGKSLDLAYAGLFRDYDPTFTSGYNYATDARVFVFEDYSYRHDRIAYYTPIEHYKVWRDNSETNSVVHFKDNDGASFDPNAVVNIEHEFYAGGTACGFSDDNPLSAENGTVQLVTDNNGNKYMRLTDTGSERGIGLRSILMTGVNKPANQLRYAVVSYKVESKGSATGDTVPMYVMLDTAGSGFDYSTVTLGFFDAVADDAWHVDVLDLSECVSRAPNGETYKYKHDTFTNNSNIQRIGIADGWAVYGAELHLAYLALFDSAKKAEQYGNAYSEAYKSIRNFPTSETGAASFAVMTNAYTADLGQVQDDLYKLNNGEKEYWEGANGSKRFRVGSNNGFELLDPDYAYNNNSFYHADTNGYDSYNQKYVPNYYKDMGFGEYVKNNSTYTNYNVGPNGQLSYYNDDHRRDISSTNGASGIWGKSVDTYGYIMGLTERQLAEVGDQKYIRYRQEVVTYLAQLLQNALNVPRTFMWYDIQFYSANYVQGDVDGDRFGYYDELLEDGSENVNAMFPRDYAGWLRYKLGVTERDGSLTGSRGKLGSWALTEPRGEALIADREQIETWTDAAYYMLNTLFLPSAGEEVPEYKYLQLVRETPAGGSEEDSYYVFDTRYTNVMFDFDRGIIGNNGIYENPDTSIKDTTNGQVATYAFLPILRELPEFQATFPYLRDNGIANKDDGADSYYNRDYNFTLECHGTFTYYADKDLFFEFDGDDDVYLYVNGTCVLDLGGAHRATNQLVRINDYVSKGILNLEENTEYPFDFYFMERHGTGSNLRIQTNMEVFSDNIQTEKTASQTIDGVTTELPDYSIADFTKPVSYSFAITNNFDPVGKLTNFSFKDSDINFYAGYDSVALGSVTADTPRQVTDLTVTVKDSGGNIVFSDTPENTDQLQIMLSNPGGRGGLAYGETLILSGVQYVIGEGHSAFSNTVISRAGKHSGVAYHHLLSGTSPIHYFAWKGHDLEIPISEIIALKDPQDTGNWSDIYRCNDSLNALNTGDVIVDRGSGVIKVNYSSTGTRRLNFTSDTSLPSRYPISVDIHVLDAADNVYVLDFDGRTNLGKDVEHNNQYSFAQNDVYSLPGVKAKVRYEAFTDEAPSYSENHLSFESDPWYKDYLTNPSAKVLVTIDSDKSYRDPAGGALEQSVTVGQPMVDVIVHPTNPFSHPLSAPSIDPSDGSGITATQIHNRLYLEAGGWWLDADASTKIRFCDSSDNADANDSTFVPMNEISSDNNVKRYWIDIPANGNYTHFRIVRYGFKDNRWQYWNASGAIALDGNNVYRVNNGDVSQLSNTSGASYMISGSPTCNTAVSFSGTATAPAVETHPDPVSPPYYFKEGERVSLSCIDNDGLEMGTNSSQGTFTVKLPDNSDELPTLYYRPKNIMDGASMIWLTSRVYEDKTGVEPSEYLGNADPHKEVEMFQRITVVPANVVYYEDVNDGIVYHQENEAGSNEYQEYQPTVTWTHGEGAAPLSPDQTADQSTPYGYDPAYTGAGHYSGNGATKITFKGNVTLAEFDFQGTGFDLFSRCMSDAPTVMAKIYEHSDEPQHEYTEQELLKTAYVITEFNNNAISEGEVMYQVPVLSIHDLDWDKYHVVLDGIGHVDMSHWSIVRENGSYYMVKDSDPPEKWKILIKENPVQYQKVQSEGQPEIITTLNPASVDTEFWLDGLRVYGALQPQDQDLYYNPNEANASFVEVRDLLTNKKGIAVNYTNDLTQISNGSFTSIVELRNETADDDLQLDENGNANLSAYFLVGPNNELYLKSSPAAQQAVAFTLSLDAAYSGTRTFQIAAKLLDTSSFGTPDSPRELSYLTAANTWKSLGTIRSGTELYYELDPTLCPQLDGAFIVIIGVPYPAEPQGGDSQTENVSLVSLTKVKYKGWNIEEKYSDEMNFLYYNNDPSTGIIIGVTPEGSEQLGAVIRLLAAARPPKPALPFSDVPADAWYADPVAWAYSNGITAGVSSDSFGPDLVCTRAQAVTFLWKAAGAPAPAQSVSFTDVPDNSWYAQAVAWAYENGITAGTSESTFSPGAVCTRAQVATFLWRCAGSPVSDWDSGFIDVASDDWYAPAVRWAAENGITAGTSANTFSPTRNCSRAEIVTFLYRSADFIIGGEQE
ncbi:MAG: S-layer homology domain-containing protein [Oscillospiraceae bacterium]|nr:S-layer homology domain-containing protein [Oscillospiraceae bacterium]